MRKVIACVLVVLYFSFTAGSILHFSPAGKYCCETVGGFSSYSSASEEELGNACSDIHYTDVTFIKAPKHVGVTATVKVPRVTAISLVLTNFSSFKNTNYNRATVPSVAPSSNQASIFIKNCVLRV